MNRQNRRFCLQKIKKLLYFFFAMQGQLYLYHVSLPDEIDLGYDSFSEFVVACKNEVTARFMHPCGWEKSQWTERDTDEWLCQARVNELVVTCIGVANENVKENQVIVASYHAG